MRVRSLFFRLFVGFWLMMMGLLLANMGSTWLLTQHFEASGRQDALVEGYAQAAMTAYRRDGLGGFQQWRQTLARATRLRTTLLDAEGQSITGERRGRWLPRELMEMPAHSPMHHRGQRPLFWSTSQDGERFTLVIFNPNELSDPWFARFTIAWRIGLSVLVVALLAWLMARYLTRPIEILRQASRRLAAGELETRVSSALAQRQDELGDLGRDFDQMAGRIQALLEGQQQLLRDVSHELRTPLARQRVALELARRKPDPGKELDRIEREAELLDQLIEEILLLLRLTGQQSVPALEPCNLALLVKDQVDNACFEQPRVSYQGPATLHAQLDPRQIGRALENVIRNALKYSADAIDVHLESTPQHAIIRVADRGPGIDAALLERIFDPFVRADAARSRDAGGWGLGLAIAARAVALHGGRIDAENRSAGGLRVTLCLPLMASAGRSAQE